MKIEIKDGSFKYGPKKTVFENMNFVVRNGEILSILGPNGTGKTTLLKCLLGIHSISGGSILIDGWEQDDDNVYHVGYVPQNHQSVFQYSVLEMVLMGRTRFIKRFSSPVAIDREIAYDSLKSVGMYGFADKIFSELSGGEKQMVLIARALASQSDCIIFDEPTSALDYRNQYRVLDLMVNLKKERNMAIIMTTHQPEHALYVSDKTLLMNCEGSSIFGDTDMILSEDNLNSTYGMNIGIFRIPHNNSHINAIVPLVADTINQQFQKTYSGEVNI